MPKSLFSAQENILKDIKNKTQQVFGKINKISFNNYIINFLLFQIKTRDNRFSRLSLYVIYGFRLKYEKLIKAQLII